MYYINNIIGEEIALERDVMCLHSLRKIDMAVEEEKKEEEEVDKKVQNKSTKKDKKGKPVTEEIVEPELEPIPEDPETKKEREMYENIAIQMKGII